MEKKSKKLEIVDKEQEEKKLSYEELEKVAMHWHKQFMEAAKQASNLQQVLSNVNDISILLSILDKAEYFDSSFIEECASRIQETTEKMLKGVEEEEKED